MPDEGGRGRSTILRSLPILLSLLLGDYVLFRLLPGVDTGANRTLRYAPILGLSAVLFLLGLVLTLRSNRGDAVSVSAAPVDSRAASGLSRLYAGFLVAGVAGSLLFAYLVGKLLVFRLDHESFWKDTSTYVAVAAGPLSSSDFWAGQRPFTLPLLYKILRADRPQFGHSGGLQRISSFQFILDVFSWTMLAIVTASLMHTKATKFLGFGVILALAMTLDVSFWDKVLLSESLASSLLILLVSLGLLGVKFRDRLGVHGSRWQILYWIGIGVLCVLYSFTRDANAYFLAACALAIVAAMTLQKVRRHSSAAAWIVFSVFLLLILLVELRTADHGRRWTVPYFNILRRRIYPDEHARDFFESAGLPADPATSRILQLANGPFVQALEFNLAARPLIDWVEADGRVTYFRYLISQPVATFVQPIGRIGSLISPSSTTYRAADYSVPIWLRLLSRLFFPLPLVVMLGWCGMVVVATYLLVRLHGLRPEWAVPGLLLLTAFPMMYVVWYGDAIEVERHAFQISVQVRLGLWLMTAFLADAWLGRIGAPQVMGGT